MNYTWRRAHAHTHSRRSDKQWYYYIDIIMSLAIIMVCSAWKQCFLFGCMLRLANGRSPVWILLAILFTIGTIIIISPLFSTCSVTRGGVTKNWVVQLRGGGGATLKLNIIILLTWFNKVISCSKTTYLWHPKFGCITSEGEPFDIGVGHVKGSSAPNYFFKKWSG